LSPAFVLAFVLVLCDRIYVAEDVKRDQILHLWSSAVKKFGEFRGQAK
jgi:hypothetical protein